MRWTKTGLLTNCMFTRMCRNSATDASEEVVDATRARGAVWQTSCTWLLCFAFLLLRVIL